MNYRAETKMTMSKRIQTFILKAVLLLLLLIFTVLLVRAFDSRRKPDLEIWHTTSLDSEFRARDHDKEYTFRDYREMEDRLFEEMEREVYQKVEPSGELLFSRYSGDGTNNPVRFPQNWNRSYELIPSEPKGGVLLIHGLTDSPYSLRRVGEIFNENGFYVLGLRLPGHGTIPAALTTIRSSDLVAAVGIGVKHVLDKTEGKPFYIVGYSTGAALAINYTLDSIDNDSMKTPDRIILFSPALGITRFATLANWHKILSFMPYFKKFKWESIQPEYDPFKYNSFPKNGGEQTHLLTLSIQEKVENTRKAGKMDRLPPILTFQSLVDATVLTNAVTGRLYNKIDNNGSELVLFDINRVSRIKPFLKNEHMKFLVSLEERTDLPFTLTIITNISNDSDEIVERSRRPGAHSFTISKLDHTWPKGIYSLSHVSIPFPPDDTLYGSGPGEGAGRELTLGSIEARGERGMLSVSMDQIMRLRYNPFFDYVERRLRNDISTVFQ